MKVKYFVRWQYATFAIAYPYNKLRLLAAIIVGLSMFQEMEGNANSKFDMTRATLRPHWDLGL